MVKNLKELMRKFNTEEKCREFLVLQRWQGVPKCPYCGCDRSYRIENGKRFKCAERTCYKKYSVTVGTIFEASNVKLTTWLPALYLILSHKKGISSIQLGKNLGVTQKTAWFMLHRIREQLKADNSTLLGGTVEADTTFVGGKIGNQTNAKRKAWAQRGGNWMENKVATLGILQRGGDLRMINLNNSPLIPQQIVRDNVEYASNLMTDEGQEYVLLRDDYYHYTVQHNAKEYARLHIHTNSIEGAFSHFKRMQLGTYHQFSPKHIQRYIDEFTFRYNSRKEKDGERFEKALTNLAGRLTYKRLVHGKENSQETTYKA
jgi:hypothetical protein